jgi:hypothetical protein
MSPLLRTCWWVGPAPSGESRDDLGLTGPDEILIRKSVRSGTFRSEVRDPLGDLGGGTLRRLVGPANSLDHCPLDSPQALTTPPAKGHDNLPFRLWFPRFIASTPSMRRFFGGSPSAFPSRWILEHSRQSRRFTNARRFKS